MNTRPIDAVLSQLRAAAAQAAARPAQPGPTDQTPTVEFSAVLGTSLGRVNQLQTSAAELARRFEAGAPDVKLHDVMIAMQKANVSFQQTIQVRNRLVAAYQEIMNLQI